MVFLTCKFLRILKFITITALMFMFFSCKKNNIIKEIPTIKKPIVDFFTITTDSIGSNQSIYITRLKSLYHRSDNEFILKNNNTINIKADEWSQILIGTKDSYLDTLLVKRGDTILLSFKNNKLQKRSKNRIIERWTYVNVMKNKEIRKKVDSLNNLFFHFDYSDSLVLFSDYSKIKIYRLVPNIDNVRNKKALFNVLKMEYLNFLNEYDMSNIHLDKAKRQYFNELLKNKFFNDILNLYHFSKDTSLVSTLSSNLFLNDSLGTNSMNYKYLYSLIFKVHFNKDKRRHAISLNQIYDSIPNYFVGNWIEKARMIIVEEMAIKGNSLDDIILYMDKFNSEYHDKDFNDYMENAYLFELRNLYNSSSEVNLLGSNNRVTNLDSLLYKLKGKLVYIDYWASWCAPCRDVMPESKLLINDYKERDIAFLYFSTDVDKNRWIKASKIEKILEYEYNYLTLNHAKSDIKNNLKINSIPRYLLFDKEGKLLLQDAPGPETEEIRAIINKYLESN